MIALARKPRGKKSDHSKFLSMLPAIASYARYAFRSLDSEAREDAVSEVIANAFVAFTRLAELGKTDIAFPTVLALFGIRQFWDGRRVGAKANSNDVYSSESRRQHFGAPGDQRWRDCLVDNTRSPVPDQTAFRIDFDNWLKTLSDRDRDIALRLCQGDRPTELARKHGISRGRVTQIRRELRKAWSAFHGEDDAVLKAKKRDDAATASV